ncbi:hypothetical protein INT80_10400 [Gallibacterium anatis]|uniref:Uncharacterized protein n=1 Tax=Gallibacterium anatis TaxID=750 RepID=A0A930URT5_9PAST|nr:hypothetical protein [Gallibacterium anatis]
MIELQKDLILTQPFVVAGHLAIKTMGDFINQTQLITGKGLRSQQNRLRIQQTASLPRPILTDCKFIDQSGIN